MKGGAQGSPRRPKGIPWVAQDATESATESAKATPKDSQREPKGAQGHPKGSQSGPKVTPKAAKSTPKTSKGSQRDKIYISNSRSTAQAAVMLRIHVHLGMFTCLRVVSHAVLWLSTRSICYLVVLMLSIYGSRSREKVVATTSAFRSDLLSAHRPMGTLSQNGYGDGKRR